MNKQSGNALIIILITIALFGTLIFTFTRSSQQGGGNFSSQQSKIIAQDILQYARSIEDGVTRVMRNGCSENQISFDYDIPGTTGYENADAPGDESCHVFSENGGRAIWQAPPAQDTTTAATYNGKLNEWFFTSTICIPKIGTGHLLTCWSDGLRDSELLLVMPWVPENVCNAYNSLLGITTMPNSTSYTQFAPNLSAKFTGSFPTSKWSAGITSAYPSYCFYDPSPTSGPGGGYHIYYVLLAR